MASKALQTLLARKKREFYRTLCAAALVAFQWARVEKCTHTTQWEMRYNEIQWEMQNRSVSEQKPRKTGEDRAKSFQSLRKDSKWTCSGLGRVVLVTFTHKGEQPAQGTGNFTSNGGMRSIRRKLKPKIGDWIRRQATYNPSPDKWHPRDLEPFADIIIALRANDREWRKCQKTEDGQMSWFSERKKR